MVGQDEFLKILVTDAQNIAEELGTTLGIIGRHFEKQSNDRGKAPTIPPLFCEPILSAEYYKRAYKYIYRR